MSHKDAPGLYFLGPYAKRVTIYSQQVRAINLIDAIEHYRAPLKGKRIAVVGGGIAGLTAAARALEYGAKVTVFEGAADLVAVQGDAIHRFVHPHLYEWPIAEGRHLKSEAGLPVLNWTAQLARDLAIDLREKWKHIKNENIGAVEAVTNVSIHKVEREGDEWAVHSSQGRQPFQAVIFAVGYGREGGDSSYWQKDGLDDITDPRNKSILIVGYGDGALTDLMRACIVQFDHLNVLTSIIKKLDDADREKIRLAEYGAVERLDRRAISAEAGAAPRKSVAEELTARYRDLRLPKVMAMLSAKGVLHSGRRIVLTGVGNNFFDPGASPLNRAIIAQLLHLGAFDHVGLASGQRISDTPSNNEPATADILGQLEAVNKRIPGGFLRFVLRTGPRRILPVDDAPPRDIEGLPTAGLAALRTAWAGISPAEDPTRLRLWEQIEPVWKGAAVVKSGPPTRETLDRCCVTIQRNSRPGAKKPSDLTWLPPMVQTAVSRLGDNRDLPFEPQFLRLEADKCVAGQEALVFTTRLLCRAPIAVFNLGDGMGNDCPELMLLLGIRAAVRRGLTLVVIEPGKEEPDWDLLPFNIKDVLVLPLRSNTESEQELYKVLVSGWRALQDDAKAYRDLPVFDAVREHGRRSPGVGSNDTEIFALCPFKQDYLDNALPRLQVIIKNFSDSQGNHFAVRPVMKYLSPLLVGERVYDLARHADRCLVDWTHWRANVFFEMGVRLAVNEAPSICVIDARHLNSKASSEALLKVFQPIPYRLDLSEDDRFGQAFLAAERSLKSRANPIYQTAKDNADARQERGAVPLAHELFRQAQAMIGGSITQQGALSFLYSTNPSLSLQVHRDILERFSASLHLIDQMKAIDGSSPELDALRARVDRSLREFERYCQDGELDLRRPKA